MQVSHDMFAHQYFDSALPVWLKGEQAQIYFTQILPPGEFEGTTLSAPKRPTEESGHGDGDTDEQEVYVPSTSDEEKREFLSAAFRFLVISCVYSANRAFIWWY